MMEGEEGPSHRPAFHRPALLTGRGGVDGKSESPGLGA